MNKHKHHDLIVAWAKGAKIQALSNTKQDIWWDIDSPKWSETTIYRIKPEPKPDVVLYGKAQVAKDIKYGEVLSVGDVRYDYDNVQFTFDGETHKLIKVEVLC